MCLHRKFDKNKYRFEKNTHVHISILGTVLWVLTEMSIEFTADGIHVRGVQFLMICFVASEGSRPRKM